MAYVITQRCCNDASCVPECPVDCIRPTPEQPEFATTEQLYIDPDTCIDCGACVDACPVEAIFSEDDLTASLARFRDINAAYFQRHPLESNFDPLVTPARPPKELGTLRVAIVGAGPAACYAADELLRRADVEVEMFDRLPTRGVWCAPVWPRIIRGPSRCLPCSRARSGVTPCSTGSMSRWANTSRTRNWPPITTR